MAETGYKIAEKALPKWHAKYKTDSTTPIDISDLFLYKKNLDQYQFPSENYTDQTNSDYPNFKNYYEWDETSVNYPWITVCPYINTYDYNTNQEKLGFIFDGTAPGFYGMSTPTLRKTLGVGTHTIGVSKNPDNGKLNMTIDGTVFSNECPYVIVFGLIGGGGGGGGGAVDSTWFADDFGGGGGGGGCQVWGVLELHGTDRRTGLGYPAITISVGSGGAGGHWSKDGQAGRGTSGQGTTLSINGKDARVVAGGGSGGYGAHYDNGIGTGGSGGSYTYINTTKNGIHIQEVLAGGSGGAGAVNDNVGSKGNPQSAYSKSLNLGGSSFYISQGVGRSGYQQGQGGGGAGITWNSKHYGYGGYGGKADDNGDGVAGTDGACFLYW